jgi:hypothetical protein
MIDDHAAFGQVVDEFRRFGLQLAIDGFGAGYAGLTGSATRSALAYRPRLSAFFGGDRHARAFSTTDAVI